ncbi:MAG: type II secretion system protein [Nitrospirae bacterium]|nr:type II secretion system protein [Nitrospirota bacterium]NTW65668.1 type II secretion system protein [Nitrospirota bacterium]
MMRINAPCGMRIEAENNPRTEIRKAPGFTYVALLAAIVILGISMGAAGKYWSFVMQREKEEELLFRGEQYRLAIERYYRALPGRNAYPPSIEELVKDSRTPTGKRHLRQAYKDPITGEDFEVVRDQTKLNRITGVYSKGDKEPLRKTGFPEQYPDFENKKAYNEWKFVYTSPAAATPTAGQTGTIIPRLPRNLPAPAPAQ